MSTQRERVYRECTCPRYVLVNSHLPLGLMNREGKTYNLLGVTFVHDENAHIPIRSLET